MNFPSHRIDQSTVSHQHLHMIIICCYKESLTQVLKNPGLFMCLVIDSPLLTMNCRSMISLLGRSNDQATTPGAAVGGKSTQKKLKITKSLCPILWRIFSDIFSSDQFDYWPPGWCWPGWLNLITLFSGWCWYSWSSGSMPQWRPVMPTWTPWPLCLSSYIILTSVPGPCHRLEFQLSGSVPALP